MPDPSRAMGTTSTCVRPQKSRSTSSRYTNDEQTARQAGGGIVNLIYSVCCAVGYLSRNPLAAKKFGSIPDFKAGTSRDLMEKTELVRNASEGRVELVHRGKCPKT